MKMTNEIGNEISVNLSESVAKEVWDDGVKVEVTPNDLYKKGVAKDKFTLYIGAEDCGVFPSYTQALEHAIALINNVDFNEE
ncbi:hypothetical protein [Endozoicomonas lisbonensis]|uniref:Uncharacterized protein n=1 Tax=Endozoicomonas lisbonensis TaxID=3120522 RepID=A0ABV2SCW9_9GAMM